VSRQVKVQWRVAGTSALVVTEVAIAPGTSARSPEVREQIARKYSVTPSSVADIVALAQEAAA
jgi:hypothetical protein